jgi:hypothetical protein
MTCSYFFGENLGTVHGIHFIFVFVSGAAGWHPLPFSRVSCHIFSLLQGFFHLALLSNYIPLFWVLGVLVFKAV